MKSSPLKARRKQKKQIPKRYVLLILKELENYLQFKFASSGSTDFRTSAYAVGTVIERFKNYRNLIPISDRK